MAEILIPKKNVVFDSQILSSLMACPRLEDLRFNHNLTSVHGKPVSFEMGLIVHKFMESYYGNIINGVKKDDARGFATAAAVDYMNSEEIRNSTEDDKNWAIQTCHQYLDYWRNDIWIPLEVETVKGSILYEDDEVRILWKARFDLIADTNQGIFPVDHKTMKQRRDTLSLDNQFIGQCVLMQTRLMFVNKIGFQKTLKPEERFTRATVNYTFDRLLEWQSVILPYYAKLYLMYTDSEYWPPNFTHCESKYGFCQFKEVCEVDRGIREEYLGREFIVGKPWEPENV